MSKTLAQLSQLLQASNEQLFDRYINFRLTKDEPSGAKLGVPGVSTRTDFSMFSFLSAPKLSSSDFQVVCPKTGMKPDITVSGSFHAQNTANNITLTVTNMNANIDTMAYNWVEIEVGYYSSGVHTSFVGQITNCYMAKPNPNGELVVSAVCANVAYLYALGDFEVKFAQDTVTTRALVMACVNAIALKYPKLKEDLNVALPTTLPKDWENQEFTVNKATYRFRSPLACIAWLNSLFMSYSVGTGFVGGKGASGIVSSFSASSEKLDLPPLRLGFDHQGKLIFTSTYANTTGGTMKSITAIGSAYLSGQAGTVTAPFNPDMLPGEVIYIDSKYFKTRVNIEATRDLYKSMSDNWWIVSVDFTFSTRTTNNMTLQVNNIQNEITTGEG